jgi:hypothetical protein
MFDHFFINVGVLHIRGFDIRRRLSALDVLSENGAIK